jgi:hypothetical protein
MLAPASQLPLLAPRSGPSLHRWMMREPRVSVALAAVDLVDRRRNNCRVVAVSTQDTDTSKAVHDAKDADGKANVEKHGG